MSSPRTVPPDHPTFQHPRAPALHRLVLRPGRPFGGNELAAMVTDGMLHRALLDAHVPVGAPQDRAAKLRIFAAVIPPHLQRRGVVGRLGAAWFYDCSPAPTPLPLLVDKDARTTTTLPPGFSLHQTAFHPHDRVRYGSLTITTALRTALDLALYVTSPAGDRALHLLMAAPHLHCPPELVLTALEAAGKKPGRRLALARVRKLGRAVERDYEVTGR